MAYGESNGHVTDDITSIIRPLSRQHNTYEINKK